MSAIYFRIGRDTFIFIQIQTKKIFSKEKDKVKFMRVYCYIFVTT